MKHDYGYTIAIPAYGRPVEFEELLQSILAMDKLPQEVVICEDFSKQRNIITDIVNQYRQKFQNSSIELNYIENPVNLGYDANIRKLIHVSSYKWVILIGNDDLFLKDSLLTIDEYCSHNPDLAMVSRSFLRFEKSINDIIGVSKNFEKDTIVKQGDPVKYIFRICGFVGGLIVRREWAIPFETDKYDGSLFYQIYLSAHAYNTKGIGYIAKPCVGARTGNPPLFGESEKDSNVHIPGSYSAEGRAAMWSGILKIAKDVGNVYNVNLIDGLRHELMTRQSFHVFEMNAGADKATLKKLKDSLCKIGLYDNIVPKFFYSLNYYLGRKSGYFYKIIRKVIQ